MTYEKNVRTITVDLIFSIIFHISLCRIHITQMASLKKKKKLYSKSYKIKCFFDSISIYLSNSSNIAPLHNTKNILLITALSW